MKKKLIAAILTGAMLVAGMSTGVWAESEKSFVYGTTGYSEEMGDAGLNPHDNYSGWSALRYGVGETLFKYNDNMEVEPWLATDYEFVDDTTVKITLRDGVKFSSGRTMDAEAVKECLEDLIAVHDRAPYDLKIDHIDADGLTLTIYTTEPCPAIINYLGDPYGAIIDMDYGIQGEGGSANVAGTGPYVATNVTPTQIDLVKNEDYWGGDVKVDNITVKSFADGSALTAALQTGDIQGTYGLQYDNYPLFENNPDYTINSCATSRCFFGQFNMESELMQDQNIRKAVEMGIDKEGFCSVIMQGRGVPAKAAFPSSFSYGNDAVETVSYDPDGAKKLLEESGWTDTDGDGYVDKDGEKLSINWLTYPTRLEQPKLAEYAQATLKDIGIDVQVNNTSDHRTFAENGDFDVYVSSTTTAPTGDPEYFFTSTVVGSKNYGKYQNDEVTKLTEKLHQSFDKDERGIAERTGHAQDDRRHERGHSALEHHVPDGLPAGATKRVGTLTVLVGHGSERVDGERRHRGQDHDRQHDGTGKDARAGARGSTEDHAHGAVHHIKAEHAVDDRRNAHEQLDERLEHATAETGRNLHHEHGRTKRDGQSDDRREQGDRERTHDHGERSVHILLGNPVRSRKERDGIEAVYEKRGQTLLGDHEDQGDHHEGHKGHARTRDGEPDVLQTAFWHNLSHVTPFSTD